MINFHIYSPRQVIELISIMSGKDQELYSIDFDFDNVKAKMLQKLPFELFTYAWSGLLITKDLLKSCIVVFSN